MALLETLGATRESAATPPGGQSSAAGPSLYIMYIARGQALEACVGELRSCAGRSVALTAFMRRNSALVDCANRYLSIHTVPPPRLSG